MSRTWSAVEGPWRGEGIAIVGVAGRFPAARSVDAFWRNLREARDCIARFTPEELRREGIDDATIRHERFVPAGAVLDDIDLFDAEFFNISPREAESMDPQQRVFLEIVQEALDDAAIDPDRACGPIGVYAGSRLSGYWLGLLHNAQFMNTMGWHQVAAGNDKDFLATQASFRFNCRGPSINVEAACSTSLLAVSLAADALIARQCEIAIAGGASIAVPHRTGYVYQPSGIASPDGVCRPFDAGANGSVLGNGVAAIVLKRADAAIRDRDRIYAVIRATAVNNDGRSKSSFAAPSVQGQAEVIAEALRRSGITAGDIQYVEAHGTGTALGDPIEITALARAFGPGRRAAPPCLVGSVKGNVGHLDPAAGVTSLIKVALSLHHGEIPPSIHFAKPNPAIDFEAAGFRVASTLMPWPTESDRRRAGVSSFGIGGTNVHVVMEQAPQVPVEAPAASHELLLLSGGSREALQRSADALAVHLEAHPESRLTDVAFTLAGRRHFRHRRSIGARTVADAIGALRAPNVREISFLPDREVCLLFPGQGTQHPGMARDLYRSEPVFRTAFDEVAESAREYVNFDLGRFVAGDDFFELDEHRLEQTEVAQPLLLGVEYACARLWMHWGIEPRAALGHSVGELVAACVCGVMSVQNAVRIICARARLMQSMQPGAMLAVSLPAHEARALEDDAIRVSSFNAPQQQTLSGPVDAIATLENRLAQRKVATRRLRTSHAFHHPSMARAADELLETLAGVQLREPRVPFLSNVTGEWIRAQEATDPRYWSAAIVEPVQFSSGVRELLRHPDRVLIECGPGAALAGLVRAHEGGGTPVIVNSLAASGSAMSDRAAILNALGSVWQSGVPIDWGVVWKTRTAQKVTLPPYPFQRKRYWIAAPEENKAPPLAPATMAPAPAPAGSPVDGCFVPGWQPASPPVAAGLKPASWIVLSDSAGLTPALCDHLRRAGHDAVAVSPGASYQRHSESLYTVDPSSGEDARRLVESLPSGHRQIRIVNCWTMNPLVSPLTAARADLGVRLGFRGPLALLQALARAGRPAASLHTFTARLFNVSPADGCDPTFAPALGLVRVLPQEMRDVRVRLVDVTWPAHPAEPQFLLSQLCGELLADAAEPVVAYRSGVRLAESFTAVPLPAPEAFERRIRSHGTYVITGGFGGVGAVLARTLSGIRNPQLVLVSRRGLETDASADGGRASGRDLVRDLEQRGATVLPFAADVSDPAQVDRLFRDIRQRCGPIAGLIHAAGVAGGGFLLSRDLDAADAVFAPKTRAAVALLSALASDRPDFVVLFSSFAAVGGGPGQGDYCGANASLDALAWFARAAGLPVTSINWPAWRDVGMAASMSLPPELEAVKRSSLAAGIDPSRGAALFASLIAADYPQAIVPPGSPVVAAATSAAAAPAPPPAVPSRETLIVAASPAPAADTDLESALQQRLASIWSEVLGSDVTIGRDNFFDLGGHSLMALQIVARVREQFPIELDLTDVLQHATLRAFSTLVLSRLVASAAAMPDDRVRAALAAGGH